MWQALVLWLDLLIAAGVGRWMPSGPCSLNEVTAEIKQALPKGMLIYPVKVGEYNLEVRKAYGNERGAQMSLGYPNDTIAYVALHRSDELVMGGAYERLAEAMSRLGQLSCDRVDKITTISPNDVDPSSQLPQVNSQIAAHASGAAFYYRRHHVREEPAEWRGKEVYGVAVSREFGRATMVTGLIVLEGLTKPAYSSPQPADMLPKEEQRKQLLTDFNNL